MNIVEEKRIEDMAKDLGSTWVVDLEGNPHDLSEVLMQCDIKSISNQLCEMGYRKASEVALEVINRLSSRVQIMMNALNCEIAEKPVPMSEFNKGAKATLEIVFKDLVEIKKKYMEGEG